MKRVLVTGGMGFIGSNFILYMLEKYKNYSIYNLDCLTYSGNPENLSEVDHIPNYCFIQGDITDRAVLDKVLKEGIDTVVHFAAESHVDRSIQNPEKFVQTNILGTQQLLESARQHQVKTFIQVSTDEVYGSLGKTGLFTETSAIQPNSPYSATKAGADLIARSYYQTFKFPVIITRCSNNYGPRQFPEKLIPLIITHALEDKTIPIYGDGQNIRDWLYVKDHCAAIDQVLHRGRAGEVYNIGGNNEQTNLEIATRILNELGKPASLLKFVPDRLGHDYRYAIDALKMKKEFLWQPYYLFENGLRETISWYQNHKEWWKSIQNRRPML